MPKPVRFGQSIPPGVVPDEDFWRHDSQCEAGDRLIINPELWFAYCQCRVRATERCKVVVEDA